MIESLTPTISSDLIGTIFDGKLEILSPVSAGERCAIYRARHVLLDRIVAVKVLNENLVAQSQIVERFKCEAQTVSMLRSPHIVAIYDYGVLENGQPYLVSEYVRGSSIGTLVEKNLSLPLSVAIDIFMQICEGFATAHRNGIIHRDIKPTKIMYSHDGHTSCLAKILDFSMARFLSTERQLSEAGNSVIGNPAYMSPEQLRGKRLDSRSDIYSLGCVMYELLSGQKPFTCVSKEECLPLHQYTPVTPFAQTSRGRNIPAVLEQIIFTCLAKEPDVRYQSMDELHDALGAALLLTLGGTYSDVAPAERYRVGRLLSKLSASAQ